MIRKFRTIEETDVVRVRSTAWSEQQNTEDDPVRLAVRIAGLLERSRRLAPGLPRGVFNFRNQEESNAWREKWTQERIDRMQAERARSRAEK